jgi:FkbM family methyltransferase
VAAAGDKTLRVEYLLDQNAIVLDVGGYEGQWASDIYSRFRCRIDVFEPLPEFAAQISSRFAANKDIIVHPYGIGAVTETAMLGVGGDASSIFKNGSKAVEVAVKEFKEWYCESGLGQIDLMKINIEGAEFALLDHLIDSGLVESIRNIQVQFHDFVPDAAQRMALLAQRLRATHMPTYRYRFVWENWRRRQEGESSRLEIAYRNVKTVSGVLDPDFVRELVEAFELSVFIETGTYRGDTLGPLMEDFESLYSIELDPALYEAAKWRFSADQKVTLLQGDSSSMLAESLTLAHGRPALVWLDAHFSGHGTAKGSLNSPVLAELDVLHKHGSGHDIIIVDDLRCFADQPKGFEVDPALDDYPQASAIAAVLRGRGFEVFVLCDALVAIPKSMMTDVALTPVLLACTKLRLGEVDNEQLAAVEDLVASATGGEAYAIEHIPTHVMHHVRYGLGGDYFHWRSLLRERAGRLEDAALDRDYATKCQLALSPRPRSSSAF